MKSFLKFLAAAALGATLMMFTLMVFFFVSVNNNFSFINGDNNNVNQRNEPIQTAPSAPATQTTTAPQSNAAPEPAPVSSVTDAPSSQADQATAQNLNHGAKPQSYSRSYSNSYSNTEDQEVVDENCTCPEDTVDENTAEEHEQVEEVPATDNCECDEEDPA